MNIYLEYIAIIFAGLVAGFINTLAGSGSLITLGLLTFLGVPATVANGSNRVGVLFQNITGGYGFYRQDKMDMRGGLILSVPAIVGSLIGANIAADLNEELMRRAIGVVMIMMLFVVLLKPKRWLEGVREKFEGNPSILQLVMFFFIGMYGGFIQAGVGIFLLAGLVLSAGYNLVNANATKMLINLMFTIVALGVFIYNDQVRWDIGILLAIGNSAGGWLAARMAVDRGAEFVRYVLIVVIVVAAANLLGVFEFVFG